jgi:hypothetical protein
MDRKTTLLAFFIVIGILTCYFINRSSSKVHPFLLNGSSTRSKPFLLSTGEYPLTVQFISDYPGVVNIIEKNDTLFLSGNTINNKRARYLYLDGYIQNVLLDSFTFVGRVNMYAGENCCDKIVKEGRWTFRRMENRTFFRLKERDDLCSCYTCCIYMDIHINEQDHEILSKLR